MNAMVRTTTDDYGSGSVVILAADDNAAYDLASADIKREWIPEIDIPDARDFEHDGVRIVGELQDELDTLLELGGRELVDAWNRSPLNDPAEFDTHRRIVYEPAPVAALTVQP